MKKIFVILTTILLLCGCSNTVSNKAAHVKPDISMEYEQYSDLSFMSEEQREFYDENISLICRICADATSLPYSAKMNNDTFCTEVINDKNYVIFDISFDNFKSDLLKVYTESEVDWLTSEKYQEYNGYVAAIDASMPIITNVEESIYEVYVNDKNRLVFTSITVVDEKSGLNDGYLIELVLTEEGWRVNYAGYKSL